MPTATMPVFLAPPKEIPVKITQSVEIDWGLPKRNTEAEFDPEFDAILDRLCEEYGIFDLLERKNKTRRSA
jgi:hypothetical protein